MDPAATKASLLKAQAFLLELKQDGRTAPCELVDLIETYIQRLEERLWEVTRRRISGRELDAHVVQIRLSYLRDLARFLPGGPVPVSPIESER